MALPGKIKRIWDNTVVIGEFPKSASLKIVVSLAVRDGIKHISMREFFLQKEQNKWYPSPNGISAPIMLPRDGQDPLYPVDDLLTLIDKVKEEAPSVALFDEANAVYSRPKKPKEA